VDGGFVAQGELVVAGGHGAELFEQVDAALDGVAGFVSDSLEQWWPAAGRSFLAAVGLLVGLDRDGGTDSASAQVGTVGVAGVGLVGQDPVGAGARVGPDRTARPGCLRARW
jgi:hypothetical protein